MRQIGGVTISAADDAQARREKLARVVLDQMYQFVGLLDVQGNTLEINRAALQGAGIQLADIQGKPFWEARWFQVSPEVTEAQRDYVRRARAGEFIRCDMEIFGDAAGDQTIVVDFSLLPVKDERGEVIFLLAEGRNITAKKQAEAEVARKNAELQSLLDRIRQLDQLKSDMFANVSHELRTPLALILGPTEELQADAGNLSDRQRHQLQVIHRNAAALLKHVNDLLDLARLDARKLEARYSRVDLAELVRAVAEQFHALAPQRSLAYAVTTPTVMASEIDAEKIERVLLNLLSNAFKFTPPGGRIHCTLTCTNEDRALLSVQDSGPGVAADMRQAIFERFRQVQQGTTRAFGGTGLGLAIAKEFVELHGGSITVTAAPGGGSLFQVELPRKAAPGVHVGRTPTQSEDPQRDIGAEGVIAELASTNDTRDIDSDTDTSNAHDAHGAHDTHDTHGLPTQAQGHGVVLVVEDNADMRRFICEALASDYHVDSAADGQEALQRARAAPPDLVVTDLMLPGLGGDRLVDEMRTHPALADVPVLVLSAKDDDALRARLLAKSVQDYVTKPFSTHELRARVRNLVTVKRARDTLRRELASQSDDLTQLTQHLIESRRALQQSEHRWWAIYEHSPVGIALTDAEGAIRTANPAFRTMLGYTEEEMQACSLSRITLVEDRASTLARVARLVAGEMREYHLQRRFQRKDGGVVWANTSVSLIPGTPESRPMLVVVAEDITEQKRAEQALARAKHELAQVTRVSTLGELAASIAHEVNQPLAAIVTNGHACLRWLDAQPADPQEAKAAAMRIIRDANRAGEVITRIRNFLRRGESLRAPVDVQGIVDDVLALVRNEAQSQRVNLRHRPAPAVPPVMADRVQVEQVLLNLVMNGIEAIHRGTASSRLLEIHAQRHHEDGIRVDVRDTGVGIELPLLARVFDAFHTTKPGGMGMGLAISRSIVEAHGGRLWVTPNDGPGVTFSFTLPTEAMAELP